MSAPLLEIENLEIAFEHGRVQAVRGISFQVERGETVAVVGESGSGKSVSALAITRLLPPPPVCQVKGAIRFEGRDLTKLSESAIRPYRGGKVAYIFQEPGASLNPVFSIGFQIIEALRLHRPEVTQPREEAARLLDQVGIRDPKKRLDDYPHQLSGGMQQRVMIAMALACHPRLLVADEPTTALDVTIQAQIMDLLRALRQSTGMAILLITHNFGIVKDFADRTQVMFQGRIVESGPTAKILESPQHPYTRALIGCIPRLGQKRRRLPTIDSLLACESAART